MESSMMETNSSVSQHKLSDKWVLWAHLPHDTDWSLKSYIKIMEINSLENLLMLQGDTRKNGKKLYVLLIRCQSNWEDPKNRDGGCFSFKISNKRVWVLE